LYPTTYLGAYQSEVDRTLSDIAEQRVLARLWEHDHTIWKPQSSEIRHRLGWLECASAMRGELKQVNHFVQEVWNQGYTQALLLGMGGSSLAPTVFSQTFGTAHHGLQLVTLDSTDPSMVSAYTTMFDPAHTLFLVSSKSGTTVETRSLFRHFYNHVAATQRESEVGQHFVAITEPQSPLADLGARYGFRQVFLADPHIGGRYAALSHFGLVPAALAGVDVSRLLDHAERMMQSCSASEEVDVNPAAQLGAILGALTQTGHDKATIVASASLSAFGAWVEQRLAESTGKEGKGILPVLHEPLGLAESYGRDRLFVHLALTGDDEEQSEQILEGIVEAGHPVVHVHLTDPYELGGQFFLWEMATAIAAYRLGLNPFDQPNVEATKRHAQRLIQTYNVSGAFPTATPAATYDDILLYGSVVAKTPQEALQTFLEQGQPGDYVAIQAYLPPPIESRHTQRHTPELGIAMKETTEINATCLSMCARIRDKYGLAATFSYGPSYLHSTGQLHKGDTGRGLFIQVTSDAAQDVPIPAEAGDLPPSISFGALQMAQAMGDGQALLEAGRRVIRFHLGSRVVERLHQLNQALV
jgi:transaldolase/glucose-6-phosphate isomerase